MGHTEGELEQPIDNLTHFFQREEENDLGNLRNDRAVLLDCVSEGRQAEVVRGRSGKAKQAIA